MRATILVDNLTKNNLSPEWGLSFYLEYEGYKILLDTGASGRFLKNAKDMGIHLQDIDFGVLSHAHYDHADGMGDFFAHNSKAVFYLREGSKENCYGKKWCFHKYIGIHKGFLKTYGKRITYVTGNYEIFPGIALVPHSTPGLEEIAKQVDLYVKEGGRLRPDSFSHEQSLVFDTERGLVIFSSCSHGGADNIIREIETAFPGKKLYAMLGGFHLYKSSEKEVRALAERIRKTGIQKIYTGHCTGERAFGILKEELGDCAEQIYTGMEIEL
ncbi:MAG: MBL fold metallo-hydrolase [Lachnospiraceae bacterium]|nr:MBL fold metallo-hydrolase [Lachnospiraceae bacterium]